MNEYANNDILIKIINHNIVDCISNLTVILNEIKILKNMFQDNEIHPDIHLESIKENWRKYKKNYTKYSFDVRNCTQSLNTYHEIFEEALKNSPEIITFDDVDQMKLTIEPLRAIIIFTIKDNPVYYSQIKGIFPNTIPGELIKN